MILTACSIRKPCAEGGDISWTPKIVGDKRCTQKKQPDGTFLNEGPFRQIYESNREIALEGEFVKGQKHGIWLHFGEDRKLKSAKYFEKGVEKTPSAEIQKKIDLIIEQKTGVK